MGDRWPHAVVFDLDGTLIDSAGDIADALNAALSGSQLPAFSDKEVRRMVGGGARVLIERALSARTGAADAALAQRLHDDFMTVYAGASIARTTVYDHARELLSELALAGIRVGVCTNKPAGITEDVLVKLELRTSFQAVVGGSDELPKKPHPAMLEAALRALGVDASQAVMVGDSAADIGAARGAGVPVIAVGFGYSRVPARELGADRVVAGLREVGEALRSLSP